MNKKGVLFTVDVVIALVLVVFIIGSMYAFYYYKTNDAVDMKQEKGFEAQFNIVLNNLAHGKYVCSLVDESGNIIKKISFCMVESTQSSFYDIALDGYGFFISDIIYGHQSPLPDNVEYIAKSVNMFVSDGDVTKEDYFNCISGNNCSLDREVTVYVWQE